MREIFETYNVLELRKIAMDYNKHTSIANVHKLNKNELINEMVKHSDHDFFKSLQSKTKAPTKTAKKPRKKNSPVPVKTEKKKTPNLFGPLSKSPPTKTAKKPRKKKSSTPVKTERKKTPISGPTPTPTPKTISEKEILKQYIDVMKNDASPELIWFVCYSVIMNLAMGYIFKKHSNDCALITNIEGYKDLFELNSETITETNAKLIAKRYLKCKANNKILVIPFTPIDDHMNVLFLNGHLNTFEHYEPHGQYTGIIGSEDAIDAPKLYNFVRMINRHLERKDQLKFVPSNQSCPSLKGLQAYSDLSLKAARELDAQNKKGDFNVMFKDPGGYCCGWSLFIIDLRLKAPKTPLLEIQREAIASLVDETNPEKTTKDLRIFMRSQMKFVFQELQRLMRESKIAINEKNIKELTTKGFSTLSAKLNKKIIDEIWKRNLLK